MFKETSLKHERGLRLFTISGHRSVNNRCDILFDLYFIVCFSLLTKFDVKLNMAVV